MSRLKAAAQDQKIKRLEADLKAEQKTTEKLTQQLETARGARRWKAPAPAKQKKLKGDTVRVVFGDTHGSCIDKQAVAALLADLKSLDPDEIIIGGDVIDCGGFLAQHQTMGYVAETEYTYEEDVIASNAFLDTLPKHAGRAKIECIEGNHDQRVERWCVTKTLRNGKDAEFLRKCFAPEFLLRFKERGIPYYRRSEKYDGLNINGWIKRDKCYFTHAISTAKHAASQAVSKTAGNIVYFHTHRPDFAQVNLVATGPVAAWCPGCISELRKYYQHSHPSDHAHGYGVQLISRTGQFIHINVPIIDGRSLLMPMINRETT